MGLALPSFVGRIASVPMAPLGPPPRPRPRHAVFREAARDVAVASGDPRVLTERDLLAGDLVLVAAAAVVVPGDARVRRRALRPVDPVVLDEDLLGRVVAGGQASHHRSDRSGGQAHLPDARSIVAAAA